MIEVIAGGVGQSCFSLKEKMMPVIIYKLTADAAPSKVYEAITEQRHLAAWWTADCKVDSAVGGEANFEFKSSDGGLDGFAYMRIENLIPGKLVEWKCTEHNYQGMTDWVGTTIRFNLQENVDGGTDIDFVHLDWTDEGGSYSRTIDGWTHFLITSLKNYLETGKGEPYSGYRVSEETLRAQ